MTTPTPPRQGVSELQAEADSLVDSLLIASNFHSLEQPQRNNDGETMKQAAMMLQRLLRLLEQPSEGERQNERDARRYRQLRDHPNIASGPYVTADDDGNTWLYGEALDVEIDAALARGEGG